jgi:hypothetical protein
MPSLEGLLHEIRQRLDYQALFEEFLPEMRGRGAERRAFCIFHENTDSPAMSVNVEDGLYHCFNPECGARGDFIEFYMRKRSLTFREAVYELARRVGLNPEMPASSGGPVNYGDVDARNEAVLAGYQPPPPANAAAGRMTTPATTPVIDEAIVVSAHERLVATAGLMEFLSVKRGLSLETVQAYHLGHDGDRYFIPVRDEAGACVNIRRYKPNAARAQDKMISWRTGFGGARLFPVQAFVEPIAEPVFLMEGEMDCLLARQHGLNAVTTTGGAGTWRNDWNTKFRDRDVVLCYDVDEPGRIGAAHVAGQLYGTARSIKVVKLPLAEPVGADFTDYIVGHGHTAQDFLALVGMTPVYTLEQAPEVPDEAREPTTVHLSQASRAEYYNAPIRVPVMVSGKTMAPYLIPRSVKMSCGMPGLKMCERCPVASRAGSLVHTLDYETNEVLQFTGIPEEQLQRKLKAKVGIPGKCTYVDPEVTASLNVEELQLIPEIDRTEAEAPYVTRAAYFIGHGLQANRSYVMTGITVPEPKKQLATHLIHSAVPSQSNIDAFQLTTDVRERLCAFQPASPGVAGLWRRLDAMYDDLERWTRIYQRRDLMLAVDLTFHSPLSFVFQGERLVRGWVELLVIGDSRTGKTTIVQRMMEHYGAGEFSSGENTSLAGLVGGLHQIGTSWALQWGRIPLNDRRLIAIDEAGNLPTEQIARMSSMRSSGIAEIIKVHTERTNARTRQIWISNPRSPRPLSTFSQGVLAVKELIGAPEDIARFDLVVSAAATDVTLAVINAAREREEPLIFTSELCHQRVMWAWSRSSAEIAFEPEATARVLMLATVMGEQYRYATEIPLVEPNEQRVKLARLAVSVATLFFSTEAGDSIIVKPEHVEFAAQFLERLYAKPSLAFDEYAAMQRRRYEIGNVHEVARIIRRQPGAVQSLMEQEQLTQRDLSEILGLDDRNELRTAIGVLRDAGFLRRQGSSFYVKTSGANAWLRRELSMDRGEGGGAVASFEQTMVPEAALPNEPSW